MVNRQWVGAIRRIRAAIVLWTMVVWSAASFADPPLQPAGNDSHDSAGPGHGTECDNPGESGAHKSETSAPTGTHPRLTKDNFTAWQSFIRADDAELAWKTIPWHLTFGDGIARADAEGKPLLLWVMNGHLLGCT